MQEQISITFQRISLHFLRQISPGLLVSSPLSCVSPCAWRGRPSTYSWPRRTPRAPQKQRRSTWPSRYRWPWRRKYVVGRTARPCWLSSSSAQSWCLRNTKVCVKLVHGDVMTRKQMALCEGNLMITGVFSSSRSNNVGNKKWQHDIETLSALPTLCKWNSLVIPLTTNQNEINNTWWRHDMKMLSALMALWPVIWSLAFLVSVNKLLNKVKLPVIWRPCGVTTMIPIKFSHVLLWRY